MYGAREVILNYLALDLNYLIEGVVQHGFGPNSWAETNFPAPRVGAKRATVLLASETVAVSMKKKFPKHRIEVVGSPWAYLLQSGSPNDTGKSSLIETSHEVRLRSATQKVLFFVRHFNLRAGFKYTKEIAHEIAHQIRNRYPDSELTFCVFWSDLLSCDWNELSRNYDIRIVCAGVRELNPPWEMHDARVNFLPQLARIIREHDICAFDTYASAVPYSLSLGKKIDLVSLKLDNSYPPFGNVHDWFVSEFTFSGNYEILPTSNNDLVNELLGMENTLSPAEFLECVPVRKFMTF